jgi:hypothetical protein
MQAFADLPAAWQAYLSELEVTHLPRPLFSPELQADPSMRNDHPLVLRQPQTGRPALYGWGCTQIHAGAGDHAQAPDPGQGGPPALVFCFRPPLERCCFVKNQLCMYLPVEDLYSALTERAQGIANGAGLVGYVRSLKKREIFGLLRELMAHCTHPE